MRTLVLAALIAWAPLARAECPKPYTGEQLVSDLQTLQVSLRNLDETTFGAAGKRLEVGIVCLSSQAPPPIFASAYRYIGTYHFLVLQDEPNARRWFRTALEIDPTHNWDATELELDHPMRAIYEQERQVAATGLTRIEGKVVNLPAGSRLTIDGRLMDDAEATLDRPHLVQQVGSADKAVRGTWVIEGNALPPQFLRDTMAPAPEEVAEAPKPRGRKKDTAGLTQPGEGLEVKTVERLRPGEKTPLLIIGALGVVGAGGIYAMSFASRGQFDLASTTDELERTRDLTNALVLTSGGVLLVGIGVGYWGIILEGGGGVGLAGHF